MPAGPVAQEWTLARGRKPLRLEARGEGASKPGTLPQNGPTTSESGESGESTRRGNRDIGKWNVAAATTLYQTFDNAAGLGACRNPQWARAGCGHRKPRGIY